MNVRKEKSYISSGIGLAVSILLFIIAYDLPQGFFGRLMVIAGIFFIILSFLSFWKPQEFGILAARIFLNNNKK
ncbi:MAG: hypothetical protein Q8Q31_04595 [Nanoarchaeota archaeon]|nr:hypothetical protein [Nanoarchaeota archaeon]